MNTPTPFTPRNVPSDNAPEILLAAAEQKISPARVKRPGFVWCPRCMWVWPEADFRADHASFPQGTPRARCLTCREGLKRIIRQKAVENGVCEVPLCYEPMHEKFKCLAHFTVEREQVEDYRARRRVRRQATAQAGLDLLEALEVAK